MNGMSPTWRVVAGLLFILVFTLIFGVFLDGFDTVLTWTSGGSTIADFTGLEAFISFGPFILWILGFGAGILLGYSGIREMLSGKKGSRSGSDLH